MPATSFLASTSLFKPMFCNLGGPPPRSQGPVPSHVDRMPLHNSPRGGQSGSCWASFMCPCGVMVRSCSLCGSTSACLCFALLRARPYSRFRGGTPGSCQSILHGVLTLWLASPCGSIVSTMRSPCSSTPVPSPSLSTTSRLCAHPFPAAPQAAARAWVCLLAATS